MKTIFTSLLADKQTLLLELVGWPALLSLLWAWLAVPEQKSWQLGLSLLMALVMLALFSFLIAAAFTAGAPRWRAALGRMGRTTPWAVLFVVALAVAFAYLERDWARMLAIGGLLAIFGPLFAWAPSRIKRPVVWVALAVFMVAGLYVPWRLIWWIPKLEGMRAQAISAAARFALAGVLYVVSWVLVGASLTRETEPPA